MSVSIIEPEQTVKKRGIIDLRQALSELSKDALTIIRKNNSVKNVSKLNREQLVAALIEQLPSSVANELPETFKLFDEERITLLEQVTAKHGFVAIGEGWTDLMTQYWQELGLLFKTKYEGQDVMAMPSELIDVVKQALAELNRKMITLNTTYLQVVKGMMYYYGALTHEQVGEITERYPMFADLPAPYMHLIINYRHYRTDISLNDQLVYHFAIPDPTLIIREQNKREELRFASFTLLQLQQAGELDYVDRTEAHRLFVDFLMKQFKLPHFEANLVANQSEFGVRAGLQLQDLLEYIRRELQVDEATLQLIVPRLILMYNNTPQWCLKGYSSAQLAKDGEANQSPQIVKEKIELGRNDLCYCGSGKKYKKCCMNR